MSAPITCQMYCGPLYCSHLSFWRQAGRIRGFCCCVADSPKEEKLRGALCGEMGQADSSGMGSVDFIVLDLNYYLKQHDRKSATLHEIALLCKYIRCQSNKLPYHVIAFIH